MITKATHTHQIQYQEYKQNSVMDLFYSLFICCCVKFKVQADGDGHQGSGHSTNDE